MKAVCVTRYGGPEVLEYREWPTPRPGPGEVLIRVETTNVNFADIQARAGAYRRGETPPFVPGLDAAGVIEELGEGVHGFGAGQRVAAFAAQGSYGEYMLAKAALTYSLPDSLSFEAASGLTAAVTAENVLTMVGGLGGGEVVLVHAAAGGVGSLAVQLARHYGARTIFGTVGSDDKADLVRAQGAHHVVNYRKDDFAARVLELTDGAGADLILDSVGGEGFAANLRCLAGFGRIVSFGQASGAPGQVSTDTLYKENRRVLGYSSGHYRRHRPEALRPAGERVIGYLDTSVLKLVIGQRFPLAKAAEAHRLVESRASRGKVLLMP